MPVGVAAQPTAVDRYVAGVVRFRGYWRQKDDIAPGGRRLLSYFEVNVPVMSQLRHMSCAKTMAWLDLFHDVVLM